MKNSMWSTIIFIGVAVLVIALAIIYRPENRGTTDTTAVATSTDTVATSSDSAVVASTTKNTKTNTNTNTNTKPMLVKTDTVVGTGAEAVNGKKVTVNYVGTLLNGTQFDSSLSAGRTPFTFALGAGQVIAGWEQGVLGMKVGGKRTLKIPPDLGYGANAYGPIPANSTLVFQIELLAVN